MGVLFLRPNGPSRTAADLLGRTHEAYQNAMAAADVLLDLREVALAIGARDDPPAVQEMPFLVYQEIPLQPTMDLGAATGSLAMEFGQTTNSVVDVHMEVLVGAPSLMIAQVAVRTDVYPAELADRIGEQFTAIIGEGPERLEP